MPVFEQWSKSLLQSFNTWDILFISCPWRSVAWCFLICSSASVPPGTPTIFLVSPSTILGIPACLCLLSTSFLVFTFIFVEHIYQSLPKKGRGRKWFWELVYLKMFLFPPHTQPIIWIRIKFYIGNNFPFEFEGILFCGFLDTNLGFEKSKAILIWSFIWPIFSLSKIL